MLKLKANINHSSCQQNIELPQRFSHFCSLFFNHFLKVILGWNMSQIHNSRNNNNSTQKSQTITFNHLLIPANEYNFKETSKITNFNNFKKFNKFIWGHKIPSLSYFGYNENLLLKFNTLSFVKILMANIMNTSSKIQGSD